MKIIICGVFVCFLLLMKLNSLLYFKAMPCDIPILAKPEIQASSVATLIDANEDPPQIVSPKTSAVKSSKQKSTTPSLQPQAKVRRIQTVQLTLSGTSGITTATGSPSVAPTSSTAAVPSTSAVQSVPTSHGVNFFKKPAKRPVTETTLPSVSSSVVVLSDDSQEAMDTTPAPDEQVDLTMKVFALFID